MHGTYHNHPRLTQGEPSILSNGDILVFGAEVKRGTDIFPACAFRVTFEYTPYNKTNTYIFPESSDVEDEEDYELSENEFDDGPSSVDGVSVENPPFKASQSDAIDLTGEESPVSFGSASRTLNITSSANPIILVDSDEDDEDFPPEASDSSDVGESDGSEAGDHSGDEIDDSVGDYSSMGRSQSVSRFSEDEEESGNEKDSDHEQKAFSGRYAPHFESDVEDDGSDFSLSEAGREGIQALFNDGLLSKEGSPDLDDEENSQNVKLEGAKETEQVNKSEPLSSVILQTILEPTLIEDQRSSLRQPSPSDAAMVKPAVPAAQIGSTIKVDHLPSNEWRGLNTLALSDKARKTAFFEARLHNKAKFETDGQVEASGSKSTISFPEIPKNTPSLARPRFGASSPVLRSWPTVGKMQMRNAPPSVPSATLSYLDDHTQAPLITQPEPTAEPDMTSAVKYNESRAILAASNKTAALFSGRSGLRIHDIIEAPSNLKRKADDISDVIGDEVRMWASSPAHDVPAKSQADAPIPESHRAASSIIASTGTKAAPDAVAPRPVKRLKRFVECLGYAALGGAAVGAGLFSVLVATAPDFM